jgi:DnaJ-class molecular chaperone
MKDLYATLGVSENADDDTIKKAYRKLAKQYHPDATGGDKKKTERFKEINDAYSILGDKQKRSEYDRLKHAPVGADGMPQGFDPDAFAQTFGGSAGMGGGRGGFSFQGDVGDIGDLFASLFGGQGGARNPFARGGGRRASQPRGADMAGELELTFPEAALGGRRTIRNGAGNSIEVQIPPGVQTGGRLRLPGQGAPAPGGKGQPGDLLLELVVRPDPHLRRDDDDVELDLPVTIGEATLGAKVDVPTLDGPVKVTIPPGTSCGAKLRLRGKGVKRPDGGRGDQLCVIKVVVPKLAPDDAESRRLVEELDRRTKARVRDY